MEVRICTIYTVLPIYLTVRFISGKLKTSVIGGRIIGQPLKRILAKEFGVNKSTIQKIRNKGNSK
jgi:hypothetical protein